MQETRVLVHSKCMVEAAKKCGISDEKLVKERDAEEGIQVYQSSSREVQQKVIEWEIADQVVHADLILKNAKRHGIDISSIADNPLSVYMSKKRKTKEVGVMAEMDSLWPLCTSFVENVEVGWL